MLLSSGVEQTNSYILEVEVEMRKKARVSVKVKNQIIIKRKHSYLYYCQGLIPLDYNNFRFYHLHSPRATSRRIRLLSLIIG